MPDPIFVQSWALLADLESDPERKAFYKEQAQKAAVEFCKDLEKELKLLDRINRPFDVEGVKVGQTISIKVPNRYR